VSREAIAKKCMLESPWRRYSNKSGVDYIRSAGSKGNVECVRRYYVLKNVRNEGTKIAKS
jgi:hypothetical protein